MTSAKTRRGFGVRMYTAAALPVLMHAGAADAESQSGRNATSPSTSLDWRAATTLIDSVVTSTMESQRIPGAAVVFVEGDSVRILRGYGVADASTRRPVDPANTIFRVGSVSKALTALGIMRLVDGGRVSLEDPVARHVSSRIGGLGKFPEPVRIRHLLAHTGGFDQVGLRRQVEHPRDRPGLEDFLAGELVQVRPPGVVGVYDTYGMTLAGHLIERLSGESYAEYMRTRVFEPLGMRDAWVEVPETIRHRLATGYGLEDGALVPQPYEWYVTLPASSVDASAADMGRLLSALLTDGANQHGRLTSRATMSRILHETQVRYAPDMAAFSWGFWEEQRDGYRALHHGGVMRGFSSELYIVPDLRIGFFVVYNRDPETGPPPMLRERLTDLLYDRLLPRNVVENEPRPRAASAPTRQFAGAYGNTLACFTCQEGEGWGMSTLRFTAPEVGALAMGTRRWVAIDSTGVLGETSLLRFIPDDAGRVRYMVRGTNSWARLDEHLLAEVLGANWQRMPPAPLVAIVHRANEQWPEAAAAYGSLAARHPANGAYPYYQGFSLLHAGRFPDALAAFEESLRRKKWIPWSRYYVASAYAGMGDSTAAVAALREAVNLGFSDRNLPMTEPWWNALRSNPEVAALLERIRH
jgi:CubicO group peptidase (beta-lactamase class C family)